MCSRRWTGVPSINLIPLFQTYLLLIVAGRKDIIQMRAAWTGLSCLPTPVATFGAWVLTNAPRDHLPSQELEAQVAILHNAVWKVGFHS
jgi:hypothetical protein